MNYLKKEISNYDKDIYYKIRKNVDEFLEKQAMIHDSEGKKLLDIAPQIHDGAKKYFIKSQVYTADIDPASNADFIIDICKENKYFIEDGYFDLIVCTEVLEHTLNPFLAIRELYRILKNNGVILITTPFDFRIHGPLPDCWRFTEHGLKALLTEFKEIELVALENSERYLMPFHYCVVAKKF